MVLHEGVAVPIIGMPALRLYMTSVVDACRSRRPFLPSASVVLTAAVGQEQTLAGLWTKKRGLHTADIHRGKPDRAASSRRWFRCPGGLGERITWMNNALKHVAARQRVKIHQNCAGWWFRCKARGRHRPRLPPAHRDRRGPRSPIVASFSRKHE